MRDVLETLRPARSSSVAVQAIISSETEWKRMTVGNRNPPSSASRGNTPLPNGFDGVEFARRFVSDRYVPDSRVLEESIAFIKSEVRTCRIYGIGPTAIGFVDGDRHIDLVVVPKGNVNSIRKRLVLGLSRLHIDADLEVITDKQLSSYAGDPNSISHSVMMKGALLA